MLGAFFVCHSIFAEPEYSHGHGALQIFDSTGIENSPRWVQIWIAIMVFSLLSSLLFIWRYVEARWILGGLVAGLLFGNFLESFFGVVQLSGLIALLHLIFWSPALYFLLRNRPFLNKKSVYSYWSGWLTFVILFSFVFDLRDAFIYLRHIL